MLRACFIALLLLLQYSVSYSSTVPNLSNIEVVPILNSSTQVLEYSYGGTDYIVGPIDDTDLDGSIYRTYSSSKIYSTYVPLAGGTLTGFLTLHSNPTSSMHAATKGYVDDQISSTYNYDPASVAITGGTISGVTISYGSLSANGVKGMTYSVTAGENLSAYDLVAIRNSSGTAKAYKYSCATGDSDKALLAVGIATSAITSGASGTVLVEGIVRNSGWTIAAADTGKTVYSSTTDGGISITAPSSSGDVIQSVGRVISGESYTIFFRPSMDYGVVQ